MEKKRTAILSIFGKNSIFYKTLIGLMLLSLAMLFFFGFWMGNLNAKNHRKQVALSNLSRLHQTGESMDLTADLLSRNMIQLFWSNDVINYLVTPGKYNTERDYRIIYHLRNSVNRSVIVKKAFLYSPLSDKIHDNYTTHASETYSDWPLLAEHYKTLPEPAQWANGMTVTYLVNHGGRLFVIQDLNVAARIGTLVFELNLEELGVALGISDAVDDAAVYVYDAHHKAIFSETGSYDLIDPNWEKTGSFLTAEDSDRLLRNGFYRYDSPDNGWTYLMPIDTQLLSIGLADIIPVYLPMAIFFLLLSFMFALYISRSIYRPINRLMTIATQSVGEPNKTDAEIDFLEDVYSDAIDRQSRMQGLIDTIAPEIVEAMFLNLLVGKGLPEQRVAEILEGVGNPVRPQDRFLVMVCRLIAPKDRDVNDVELNLHLLSIRNLLQRIVSENCRVYDLHTDKMIVAVVLGFPSDMPTVEITREYGKLSEHLLQMGKDTPFGLQVERSNIYQNIMDIRFAYHEGLENLQYQQYLENDDAEIETDIDPEQMTNRRYFQKRVNALMELAAQGDRSGAEELAKRTLTELPHAAEGTDRFEEWTGLFMDSLTERMVALPLSEEAQLLIEQMHEKSVRKDRDAIMAHALDYAQLAIRLMHSYGGKNRYKYVERAKEYIANNYANSSLSLNDVADHIGISASYLSELFFEVSGEKFSAYLAEYRVEKARQLLRTTNTTIKEIGFLCGFNSIQNFIRVFKKVTNDTPGHYREERH